MLTFQGCYVDEMKLSVFKVLLFQMKHSQTSFIVRNVSSYISFFIVSSFIVRTSSSCLMSKGNILCGIKGLS